MKKQMKFKGVLELNGYLEDLCEEVKSGQMKGAQASIWKWDALVANPELAIHAEWDSFCGLCEDYQGEDYQGCNGCPIEPCASGREDWDQMEDAGTPDEWLKGAKAFKARLKRDIKAHNQRSE